MEVGANLNKGFLLVLFFDNSSLKSLQSAHRQNYIKPISVTT